MSEWDEMWQKPFDYTAMNGLGTYATKFVEWRKMLASMTTAELRIGVFTSLAEDAANYVSEGLDKAAAVDELQDIATSSGVLVDLLDRPDDLQTIISDAFAKVVVPAVKKVRGNGHSKRHAPPKPVDIPLVFPFPIKSEQLPQRAWVVPGLLLRRHVSVLVAPPGSGKSLLTLQLALMMGTGTPWGGWHPRGTLKTLVINSEDDSDEMRRRLYAACKIMDLEQEQLRDRIAFADQPETVIIAKSNYRTKTVTRTPMVDNIVATIIAGGFDAVIIDPFAETFEGDENSNSELKWAAVLWREIARRANCAVLLVHHTRKYATGGAGDMDAARGAGALVGVARVVSTVFTMTEQEALAFDIDSEQRHQYLRFDDAKANLSLITFKARWFFKRTYDLDNAGDGVPADQVGALVPWTPINVFDKVDTNIARIILLAIDKGILGKDGTASGDLFTLTRRGKNSVRWAGALVQSHVSCSDKDAQKLLNTWHKTGVIYEVVQETSTSKGQPRKGLKVDMSKLPGTVDQ